MTYDKAMPVLPFRIDFETKEALKRLAKQQDKSLQVLVRNIVIDYLIEHGHVSYDRKFNI